MVDASTLGTTSFAKELRTIRGEVYSCLRWVQKFHFWGWRIPANQPFFVRFPLLFFFAVGLGRYEVAVATVGMLIKHSLLGHLPFSSMMFPYFPWNVPFLRDLPLPIDPFWERKKGSTSAIDSIRRLWMIPRISGDEITVGQHQGALTAHDVGAGWPYSCAPFWRKRFGIFGAWDLNHWRKVVWGFHRGYNMV